MSEVSQVSHLVIAFDESLNKVIQKEQANGCVGLLLVGYRGERENAQPDVMLTS